jgi:orotidine-5'-phosphate decarboxylase
VSATFGVRLAARVGERESQVVLGLDPDPARLWPDAVEAAPSSGTPAERAAAAVAVHCAALIAAAGSACVAVKPQVACFERLGPPGWIALAVTCAHAREAGLLVLADAKRGDIDVTAAAYAQAFLTGTPSPFGDIPGLGADAITVNPYLGRDALEPFVDAARDAAAGLFVLVRTSNPGARDVEDLPVAVDGATVPVHECVAALVAGLDEGDGDGGGPLSSVGAVVGATEPRHVGRLRELMPRAPFLLPGIGAQGGRVEDLAPAFAPGRAGGLITASRSIARAHEQSGESPATAALREAERLREVAWSLA